MPNSERMGIPIGAVLDEDKTDQYLGAETDVSYPRSFKNHSTLIDDLKACFGPNCPPYRRKGAGRTMAERLANEEYEASNVSELIDSMTELIFNYMPEEKAVDHERVKALAEVTDKSELLNSLKSMTLTERLSYLMINNPRGYDYLKRRLNYYYRFSRNQVTKTDYEQYYNDAKGEWESRPKKIKLHFDGDWEAVKRGLLRDSLYAAMIGSPELASWKMAMTKTDGHVKSDFPVLRGFESGINEDSIGDWEVLIDEYQKLATRIAKRHPELTDEELEAKQVRQIADIFAESTYYNPHDRTRGSSYVGLFPEAVAWAQLGEGAKNQLWGMRNKIEGSDLWNIGRFIGKSGDSVKSFLSEQRYLQYKTDLLQNSPESEEAQEFLVKENAEALRRAGRWYEREKKKIDKWYQKSLRKIASYEIAVAEKEQIQRKVETQLAEKLQWLDNEYRTEQAHLENRQTDELLQVLQARQKKVADKIEKHTNLATKAIDLHFASRNEEVDWINQIPFSLIKKAHRRLYEEESITDIIQDTFRAIYAGVVTDPENINDTIINNSHLDYYERKNLLTIASKLYGSDKKYSCSQLISMKDYARMWFSQRNERRAWKSEHFEQNVGQICTQYDNDYDRVKQNIAPEKLDLIFSKGISLLGLVELMNQGLENVDLIVNYSWLANEYRQGEKYAQAANEFPLYKSDNAKYNWCAKNAFVYLDGDWGRATIGKIIFTRLQTGIENNLHDASQWLQTFQMPEQTYNIPALKEAIKNGESVDNLGQFRMTLYNQSEELKFLWNVLQAPLELRARINLSRKQQAISGLFASPESMLIYDELVKIYRDDDCSWEKLQEMVKAEINNFYLNNIQNPNGKPSQWRMSIDEFSQKVQQALIQLNQ
ncbi:hypothetical protein IJI99_02095, partial [bacterium]|nr:hypothetical protein [bacterium]